MVIQRPCGLLPMMAMTTLPFDCRADGVFLSCLVIRSARSFWSVACLMVIASLMGRMVILTPRPVALSPSIDSSIRFVSKSPRAGPSCRRVLVTDLFGGLKSVWTVISFGAKRLTSLTLFMLCMVLVAVTVWSRLATWFSRQRGSRLFLIFMGRTWPKSVSRDSVIFKLVFSEVLSFSCSDRLAGIFCICLCSSRFAVTRL